MEIGNILSLLLGTLDCRFRDHRSEDTFIHSFSIVELKMQQRNLVTENPDLLDEECSGRATGTQLNNKESEHLLIQPPQTEIKAESLTEKWFKEQEQTRTQKCWCNLRLFMVVMKL